LSKFLVLTLVVLIGGCATGPTRIQADHTEVTATDKSFMVNSPVGWVMQTDLEGTLLLSRDGFLLEYVKMAHRPLGKAFPKLKKSAQDTMLPSELAELQVAELKASGELLANLTVVDNQPVRLSGLDGFRVHAQFKNKRGLPFDVIVWGVADKGGYSIIEYAAPSLYYFDHYLPDVEQMVASFRLTPHGRSAVL
jgi:hypothetical protein